VTLVVLLGGARAGKSALAVELAAASGARVTYLATAEALDEEMAERIAVHRRERPEHWQTVEEPVELRAAVSRVPVAETLVVDCLSLWAANVLERLGAPAVETEARRAAEVAAARDGLTVAVSNEVGLGIVPATPLGRAYRDVLGRVNAAWVAASDRAALVVAGRTLQLDAPSEVLR
jgi:adenosylcobinamide kinase / adenosylcobinamide-phosphate guanylyltransferase